MSTRISSVEPDRYLAMDVADLEDSVGDVTARQVNPLQVALLRWYEASEAKE